MVFQVRFAHTNLETKKFVLLFSIKSQVFGFHGINTQSKTFTCLELSAFETVFSIKAWSKGTLCTVRTRTRELTVKHLLVWRVHHLESSLLDGEVGQWDQEFWSILCLPTQWGSLQREQFPTFFFVWLCFGIRNNFIDRRKIQGIQRSPYCREYKRCFQFVTRCFHIIGAQFPTIWSLWPTLTNIISFGISHVVEPWI